MKTNFIVQFVKKEEDKKGIRYIFDVQIEGRAYTSYSCSLNKAGEMISFSNEFKILGEENPTLKEKVLCRCREQLEQLKDVI